MCRENKWVHMHPFEPFLPREATHLIVGTLPPPRFFYRKFKEGGCLFLLWEYRWSIVAHFGSHIRTGTKV